MNSKISEAEESKEGNCKKPGAIFMDKKGSNEQRKQRDNDDSSDSDYSEDKSREKQTNKFKQKDEESKCSEYSGDSIQKFEDKENAKNESKNQRNTAPENEEEKVKDNSNDDKSNKDRKELKQFKNGQKKVGKQQKGNESSSDQLKNIPESGNKKKLNNKKSNDKKSIEKDKMKIFKKSIKKSYLSLSEESDEEKSKSDKLKVVKPAPKQIKQKKEAPQSNQSDKDPLNKYLKHEENLGMKNELEYNSSDNKPKKDSVKSSMNSKSKKDIENSDLNAHRLSKKNEDLDNKLSPPTNQGDETIKPTESKSYLKKILKEGSSDRKNKNKNNFAIRNRKAIVKLPKFKENKGKEREFKFETIENSSSTTFEENKDEEINHNFPTKFNIQMKEAVRKYIVYLFVKRTGKWTDVLQEDIKNVERAFDITTCQNKSELLNIVVKDFKTIEIDRLERKIEEAIFVTSDMVGNITQERIPKLVIRIKDEIIPHSLLPVEIFGSDKNYKINGLSEIIGKVIEQVKTSTENMDTKISIVVPIPNDLKSYITSSSKLPGQNHFFQNIKSKDYYFNPDYIIEDSISINQGNIQMNVSAFNAEVIQKDLEEYVLSIKLKEIDYQLITNIENYDEKEKLVDDIQNIIYPKLLKEDQIILSLNIEKNKAIFICS